MDTENFHIRLATFDDYEAVLDINDNINDGMDYVPTLYHHFLQSRDHFLYVAESDNKLIGFVNFRLSRDGKTAVPASGRVRIGYQGKGVTYLIFARFRRDHPAVTSVIFDGVIQPASQKVLNNSECLYQWNSLLYRVSACTLKTWSTTAGKVLQAKVLKPTHSEGIALAASGVCEKFLRKFSVDFIPSAEVTWRPVHLSTNELKELITTTNTLVTFADDTSESSVNRECSALTFEQCTQSTEMCAISFSSCMLLKSKSKAGSCRAEVAFFGNLPLDFVEHLFIHLQHLAHVCRACDLYVCLHFPLGIDASGVEKQIGTLLGLDMELMSSLQAYLARSLLTD